ncbi:hypothetical protein [Wolbachia endosymbiont of Folsomia candida]|uniref:hypothetical protein n=1 Tax=Wolbachia endosymbiont of Folsomia candida TaxID=169402 RepID=UPI000B104162|nr:hypothetical protein [Wolbachia endosymbiont of Folsomia candida]APR99053.1 hypothetical protein ASM33_07680 [Wolbachia endosymbiont of Folsomia candida]
MYAKEVDYNTTVKVSLTWEISSKDIAGCKIEDRNNLLYELFGKMLISKIQVEAFINFEEIRNDERLTERLSESSIEEGIAEIKQFMEDYPDGFKEGGNKDKSAETITDGFPIKVEMVLEGNIDSFPITLETVLEGKMENWTEEFHIEVNGKAVDVKELMSMINEHHQSSDDWACVFPVDYMSVA